MKSNGLPNKYTFNLAEKKQSKSGLGSGLDFENINKGFYDELEQQDLILNEGKQQLRNIKNSTIKECVYSNKNVPDNWKNKFHYQNDMLKLFSKDERFVAYLGKGGTIGESAESKPGSANQSSLPKLGAAQAGIAGSVIKEMNEQEGINTNRAKTANNTKMKFFSMKKQTEYNDKDILNILDDFRNAYPIQKPEVIKQNQTATGFRSNGWLTMRHMKMEDKQNMFKTSIYTNLLPSNVSERAKSSKAKIKQEEKKTDFGPFLNFDYEAFNKKIEITNPIVKKQLEGINYFGPFYSHCPSCKNRNLEFYENMESNQCIQLLKCIKKSRGKTAIVKERKNLTSVNCK